MKVLFIGHDIEINTTIKRLMGNSFPKVQMVEPSESADLMELMTTDGPFAFVVVAIDNKSITVNELYESINEVLGQRPFIFIGSPNSVKSYITSAILQKPLMNFVIETPLIPDDFKKSVSGSIEWVKKEEFEESIIEFSRDDLHKMRLRNFYLFEQLPYDVYLELTSTKFGKVIAKNKTYTHQLIQNYSRKNIKFLHLRKDEHLKFLDTSIKNLLKIYEAKLGDRKKYVVLHLKTIFFIHQFIKTVSVSDDIIKLTHYFIGTAREVVKSQESMTELLDHLTENPNLTFAEHSLATAYLCESILYYMGWSADMSRDKLLLASILQDISLTNDEMIKIRSLNDPNLKNYTEEEQLEFKNHPQQAALIATYFNGFSDVDFILSEQHEHPTGDGFPKGLNSSGLTTISCIFILASNFVSRIAGTKKTPTTYKEIMASMKRIYHTGNFKDPLKALEKSLKRTN
ncbi:MAG: HD domain-containing phosphohydrolase [Bacteriovorax sp.]|nr:HD domain-containing phosphohydrolase [Bacteriovorax sp.]